MADTQPSPVQPGPARAVSGDVTRWIGWVLFAGIVLFTAGAFNIVEGLVAAFDQGYYLVAQSRLVVDVDYATWGWALVAFGVLLTAAGYGVLTGRTWARIVGVVVAVLNALVNLAFVAAYPVWTVLTVALDVIVIYALVVHGREARVFRD
jgi:hypothetical protein